MADRKHQDLLAWQESMLLAKFVYALTSEFPREELYGLTAQMRRAAVSVPSNIAEGAARSGKREFIHFLTLARGSLSELDTQLRIAEDLQYPGNFTAINTHIERVFKLLGGLINSLRDKE
ncbi:MAG: four helix bundle protein [Rhodocyclales bacterium]|nr:four helix bundle protein [Rhodocyclales bacterium]